MARNNLPSDIITNQGSIIIVRATNASSIVKSRSQTGRHINSITKLSTTSIAKISIANLNNI